MFDPALLSIEEIYIFVLALIRTFALLAAVPVIGSEQVPATVKTGLSLLLVILTFSSIPRESVVIAPDLLTLLFIILKEVLLGAAIGFAGRFVFAIVMFAGHIIGFQVGLSMSNVLDPTTNIQVPIIGQILNIFAMILFLEFNAHHWVLFGLFESYRTLPLGELSLERLGPLSIVFGELVRQIFVLGFQISAPIMVIIMIKHATMGIIGKMAPQINLLTVGIPIQIFLGIVVLVILLPSIRYFLEAVFGRYHDVIATIMRLFAP
ncbi:flagellar biosynthetic protein FliR [Chrysiogenes arsenatis]|uniref:flagellar biosynthetic protein FliR n=1 Tax=Chrysiogenes arsenatis TaxID=309797 RepID=UPI00040CDF25|nr:flagellar biosynthetic protein FliR [Chrysiogenes arsenatis]